MTALFDAPSSGAPVTMTSIPSLVRPSTSSFSECGRTTTLRLAVWTTPSAPGSTRPYIASSSFLFLPRLRDGAADEAAWRGAGLPFAPLARAASPGGCSNSRQTVRQNVTIGSSGSFRAITHPATENRISATSRTASIITIHSSALTACLPHGNENALDQPPPQRPGDEPDDRVVGDVPDAVDHEVRDVGPLLILIQLFNFTENRPPFIKHGWSPLPVREPRRPETCWPPGLLGAQRYTRAGAESSARYGFPTCRGLWAQCSFSAKLRHWRASGFSISSTSFGLRRSTTVSPRVNFVLACPSQNNVVPGFTRDALITTVIFEDTTTGRNERLCGQMGVMQMASTDASMMGPPAETLYAVDPLGVATMTPSPKYRTPLSPSARSSSSIMWNGGPAVTTASFKAVAVKRRFDSTSLQSFESHWIPAASTDASSTCRELTGSFCETSSSK